MAQMPRQTLIPIEHGGEKFPGSYFVNFAFGFVAPYLLIERVQKLLPGGCAGEGGAVVERSAETAKIEQAFRRAVERNAHAVQQVDDARRCIAHRLHRRLVGQKVAAVNRVVKVLPGGVALAL